MPKLDLNFDGVGEVPPEGIYLLQCKKSTVKPTKNSTDGALTLGLIMTLVNPDDPKWEGFEVREYTSATSAESRWRVQEILESFTGEKFRDDNMEFDTDDLEGMRAQGICFHDDYGGRTNLKVRNFFAEGEEAPEAAGTSRTL